MNHHDDDLQQVIDRLRADRPELSALELDDIKRRVRTRVVRRPSGRAQLMKSRLTILVMLVLGMLLSTTGAGLAISGLANKQASVAQYGAERPSAPEGEVLGEEEAGAGPAEQAPAGGGAAPSQPARQVEVGAGGGELPFTGLAAIPILLGGVALLTGGLVLRRGTRGERA